MNIIPGVVTFATLALMIAVLIPILSTTEESISIAHNTSVEETESYDLIPNHETVLVSGFTLNKSNAGAISSGTSGEKHVISAEWTTRVRQDGVIESARIFTGSNIGHADITGIYIEVWRFDGSAYDLVGKSENILSKISSSPLTRINFDLDTPISGVQEGDLVGLDIRSASDVTDVITVANGTFTPASQYHIDGIPSTVDFDWESQTTSGQYILVHTYMDIAPSIVFFGDSITAGHPFSYSYLEPVTTFTLGTPASNIISDSLGVTYQNMGIGNTETGQGLSRINRDVVDLHPRLVVLNYGTNDAGGGIPLATFESDYDDILTTLMANDIEVLCMMITPTDRDILGVLDPRDQARIDINESIQDMCGGYGMTIVSLENVLGDGGLPNALRPDYDPGDRLHPNEAGHVQMANEILEVFESSSSGWVALYAETSAHTQSSTGLVVLVVFVFAAIIIIGALKIFF